MANISAATSEKVISLKHFLGLNENPDGDNKLKLGEASVCRNFKITNSGNLRKRAGTTLQYTLGTNAPVMGFWHGWVNKREIFVAACDGKLWLLMDNGSMLQNPTNLGNYATTNDVCMFGFDEKLWLLNGNKYACLYYSSNSWHLDDATSGSYGYRPLVVITMPPTGGGELLEQVNKLNGMRRIWISPDGNNATFQLPETGLSSIDYVCPPNDRAHSLVEGTDYAVDTTNGTVTFKQSGSDYAPPLGVNSYEIGYTYPTTYASQVSAMKYAELYAGTQDNRVFLYGNGTNRAFYSGLDYDGHPRADYFPDMNEVTVGDSNTPITGMIRHYSKLLAFKPEQCYSLDYGVVTLADTRLTPSFYSTPLNKIIGNEAVGQVQLVLNAPRTLCKGSLYEWRNGSSYSANISIDERQAKLISERINATLRAMDFTKVHCYDDNLNNEYYIIDKDGNALVHNYVSDAWYYYTGIDARVVIEVGGSLYIGTKTGKILKLDETVMGDYGSESATATASPNLTPTVVVATFGTKQNHVSGVYTFEYIGSSKWKLGTTEITTTNLGTQYGISYDGTPAKGNAITVTYFYTKPIDCLWESGSIDFGASNMRKYSALMWVGLKAENNNAVTVTAKTDRSIDNTLAVVDPEYEAGSLLKIKRCKVKVKKFVYYKLCFKSLDDTSTATVVDTEIKVRYTAQAK